MHASLTQVGAAVARLTVEAMLTWPFFVFVALAADEDVVDVVEEVVE